MKKIKSFDIIDNLNMSIKNTYKLIYKTIYFVFDLYLYVKIL